MSSRSGEVDESAELRRLPHGRHGLSREFVTRNQRERITAGTIATVAERGYRDTSVTLISAAAGVSRRTFYAYFATKEECFFDTYDILEKHLFQSLDEAGAGMRSWSARVRARVKALLDFLSANPDLVRFALLAPPAAGGEVGERSREFLARLVDRLAGGSPARPEGETIQLEAMAGAISAILVAGVTPSGRGSLRTAGPQLVELVLTPFVGRQRAAAAAAAGTP